MSVYLPKGYRVAGVHCGIKSDPNNEDLTLIVSDRPAVAAGVYTQCQVVAASVILNRSRTPSDSIRSVVINSGNANACTGEQGQQDAEEMAQLAESLCKAGEGQSLVLSTGIIGEHLPMDLVRSGIAAVSEKLSDSETEIISAARGMMTTDTVHKIECCDYSRDGVEYRITGMAKGAAMIGPNMATMLAVVMTDAVIGQEDAQRLLKEAVDESFNCISVDGHMSTNDTVLLLANGARGGEPLAGRELTRFGDSLTELCEDLAREIPNDGEGATHLITIEVHGCATREDAQKIAKTVANSPLVKTAIAGADPNWGRVVSAAGAAEVSFDPAGVTLYINDSLLYESGAPVGFEEEKVSRSISEKRDTSVVLLFSEGSASARFWTSDLTAEYVRLNADYHT